MAGVRRTARIAALQALFEIDLTGHQLEEVLQRRLAEVRPSPEGPGRATTDAPAPNEVIEIGDLPPEGRELATALVRGVVVHLDAIDDMIRRAAPAWPLEQMARIDKNILRLAICEILYYRRTPLKVVINEAVELAKIFGGDNSAKFVNGVLGWVSTHVAH
ncbi:MAG: transcription antitermination factor NusB [Chloroflexi bacterium]|nr:transcription antitermination factor NusB [Chloroflexota bacterium]